MSLPYKSVATIDSPEFINLQPLDINPLMSKCEIKVFYLGENRNQSFISKDVALEMAKTLRGAPIVGYFKEDKDDFLDHGNQIIMDGDGIHFNNLTRPYGFVAPNAEVWFQKFKDTDAFGNEIEREYLMTTGYLWTGQYEEAQQIIDDGKPQSMELDESTLDGRWASNYKNGMEFFIINDAVISKLCILGDSVEPCFEGASITAPAQQYTLDDGFKKSLFKMMKELEFALKGDNVVEENQVIDTEMTPEAEVQFEEESQIEEAGVVEDQDHIEDASNSTDFAKDEDEKQQEQEEEADASEDEANDDDDEKEKNVQHSLHTDEEYAELENKYQLLNDQYEALQQENEALTNFKNKVEDQQKDELIAKFYMLSDEDKADVIANKRQYSLEDIESKLAVICYRKKINFVTDASSNHEEEITTFNMSDSMDDSTPDWVKMVEENQKKL